MVVNVRITLRGRLFDFWAGIAGGGVEGNLVPRAFPFLREKP